MDGIIAGIIIVIAFVVFFGLWFYNKKYPKKTREYNRNTKRIARLRANISCINRYVWVDSSKKKTIEDEIFDSKKRAFIELFANGKLVYYYVYGINGEFYEWECSYEIKDNQIFMQPYFNAKSRYNKKENRNRFQIFEINEKGLKYVGEWIRETNTKPKRKAPYSEYTNLIKS